MLETIKSWARKIKTDVTALFIATRDKRTPLSAKVVAIGVVAYALSPIDLLPDFIPVIGYIDDLLILPLGIILAVRLIPIPLMTEYREQAASHSQLPTSRVGAVFVIAIWLVSILALGWWLTAK